ncbi:phosphodiester glycosidase family protein [Hymenobacter monticola]|uniref:Phosphodiester glycosidase family protein n=1 Tax=Hymenobacter monticola TaxID=1705399 RepID=A0ABY4B4H2_9BACT|nr:phosphodiester glycosidase family protein [Hymenobacter monticola]UOE33704.1 phosphodiester glycosidase family protein [Hymenobacter monticola]
MKTSYVSYRLDPRRQALRMYWRDSQGRRYASLGGLRQALATQHDSMLFAMNGGMFDPSFTPQGLFIEAGKTVVPLDTATGAGNFYLKPNGVFYLTTDSTAHICQTAAFRNNGRVAYATQSGPMLLIDGRLHPAFRPGSANLQIRNGVGILPNGQVLLAMSRRKINFYDFAEYFRKAGCRQALYLDGYVSRTYKPAAGSTQTDGDFGVIIGVTIPKP